MNPIVYLLLYAALVVIIAAPHQVIGRRRQRGEPGLAARIGIASIAPLILLWIMGKVVKELVVEIGVLASETLDDLRLIMRARNKARD